MWANVMMDQRKLDVARRALGVDTETIRLRRAQGSCGRVRRQPARLYRRGRRQRKWKGGRYGNGQLVLLPDQDLLRVVAKKAS
jgi:hypothetical protein